MKIHHILISYYLISLTAGDNDQPLSLTSLVKGEYVVTACEGDVAHLNCTEGDVIHIVKVFYGRDEKFTCATDGSTDSWDIGCHAINALPVVSSRCNNMSYCNVTASNELYSDPCPGIVKYLRLDYNCTDSFPTTTTEYITTTTPVVTSYTTPTSTVQIESPSTQTKMKHCGALLDSGLNWPETNAGHKAELPCPITSQGYKTGNASWDCHETNGNWIGQPDMVQCIGCIQTFIQQFNMMRASTMEEINKLEKDTLTGDNIRELVHFFISLQTTLETDLKLLNNSQQKKDAITNIHQAVFGISSFLLSSNKLEIWKKDLAVEDRENMSSNIVDVIEKISFKRALITNQSFSHNTSYLSLKMDVIKAAEIKSELVFHGIDQNEDSKRNMITLPAHAIRKLSYDGVARVLFVSYSDLHELLGARPTSMVDGSNPGSNNANKYAGFIGTKVISASINGRSKVLLDEPIIYTLEHLINEDDNLTNVSCAYWEFPDGRWKGGWKMDGCYVIESHSTHTTCLCNHFTNFAVLMTVSGQMDHMTDVRHSFALSFITYFGCIISIIALLASFLVFTFVSSIQCKRNTIHKNVVICLCISELIFLIGISPTSSKINGFPQILCSMVALCLHFLFLSTFMWMFLEGVQLYIMLVQVFVIKMSRALWYYVFSYGASAIIVIISASVNFSGYGTEHYCWLSTENGFIWAFVGPVCFIIAMNVIFLTMAVFVMCKHTYFANTKVMDKDSVTQIGSWVKGLVTLVVLLGLTWVFGVLYISKGTIVMAYIFTILNSFQGLFIFIFHCVLNEKVRKAFKRNFKDWSPVQNCLSFRSMTSSSSPRASSSNNNNICKKRSYSTSVTPENPLDCLYKKIHNRKISTSTQPRSSVVLISQQRTSISFQQSNSSNNNNNNSDANGIINDASTNHIYSEPTLEDPSAYLDPTLIRLDPEEEMAWSLGYSHIEGSVADTDYLEELGRPRRNIYTNEPQSLHLYRNASLVPQDDSPSSRLDIKKYQLRRNTEGSPVSPYTSYLNNDPNNLASYPKLVVIGRYPSMTDRL